MKKRPFALCMTVVSCLLGLSATAVLIGQDIFSQPDRTIDDRNRVSVVPHQQTTAGQWSIDGSRPVLQQSTRMRQPVEIRGNATRQSKPAMASSVFATPQRRNPALQKVSELHRVLIEANDDKQREKLAADLRTLLEDIYDSELKQRDDELDELEKKVGKLRAAIEKRRKNRDRVIGNYVDSAMLQSEGLGFPNQGPSFGTGQQWSRRVFGFGNPPQTPWEALPATRDNATAATDIRRADVPARPRSFSSTGRAITKNSFTDQRFPQRDFNGPFDAAPVDRGEDRGTSNGGYGGGGYGGRGYGGRGYDGAHRGRNPRRARGRDESYDEASDPFAPDSSSDDTGSGGGLEAESDGLFGEALDEATTEEASAPAEADSSDTGDDPFE